ncbi:HWE histidine kinase domain-containing protein [Caulobacter sp. RL271]|jgi:two-component sensor histidine kinase/PAS domain-containing protein/CheY-like chemotaxis protein|uniref:histidine kinase n=1 Tax=Caulobacter segnis TaxID=88688 RepID=A0ABY4ZW39_9CAUL|nr:HWE histidine kinase domain-containing protein [Caulobacter segnis]USQ96207.1 PAS domain-containing protein [Caulobacter segnis]
MEDAPIVSDDRQETARLNALRALDILNGAPNEPRFLRFARLAAKLFDAPKAALVLVDADRIWRMAYVGYPGPEGPRDGDLAARVVAANAPIGLAVPIRDTQGHALGALVVEGPGTTGVASDDDLQALEDLADLAAISLAAKPCAARNLESERLDLAISAASLGEFEWDVKRDVFKISPRLAKISDIPAGEIPGENGQALYRYLHADDQAWLKESVDRQLAETDRYEAEYRRPNGPDGREIWNHGSGVILRDANGEPAYLIGVVQDITERRAEEEQRENLVVELDHRIKNLLAVVQSVAAQSARKSASLDVFLKTFAGRLKSMSSAHDLLTAARWRGATLARIAAAELGGLSPTQTRWDGPEMFLTPRAAAALSLALHELAVNAMRYGSLSSENGKVEVVWRRTPEGGFALEWLETGGPPATEPKTKGFGATLIEDVAGRELGGSARINYKPSGVTAMIQGAAEALADAPPVEVESAAPERIVETVVAADETVRPGAIAGLKVLIVEDSLLLALELEAGLEDAGVEVVGCAAELSEALSMVELDFDVAVLDADLNGQSVAPVAEILRTIGRPFVFATGYADKAAPMGFDAPIVRKPYNVHQIARAVAGVTGRV